MPKALLLVLFFLLPGICIAQLPAFTVSAEATPETCPGNGALNFTVLGTNPSATLDYAVYLNPSPTPVAVVTVPTVTGLVAGTYLVVATQSLGGNSNTSSVTIVIEDQKVPLVFNITQTPSCTNDGGITVNVTAGVAVSYEIISGPVTKPVQVSNTFNGLPVGQYQVKVMDNCGGVYVVTYEVTAMAAGIAIDTATFDTFELPDCNSITVMHEFLSNGGSAAILFPLTFEFIVFPPGGGAPVSVTQTVASGSQTEVNMIYVTIPFYYNQQYSYNVKVTDACGNVFIRNGNGVNLNLRAFFVSENPGCDDFSISVVPQYYVAPYTISFENAPDGFIPEDFNSNHPSFTTVAAIYGTEDNPVPAGDYSVLITDACGRTVAKSLEVTNTVPPSYSTETNATTCLGQVTISLPGRAFDTVVITEADDDYMGMLPDNVSQYITPEGFMMAGLPIGEYVFVVTDACGEAYDLSIEVLPAGPDFLVDIFQRPGCNIGEGSLRLRILGTEISGVTIVSTDADGFDEVLPYDVSFNLAADGQFYMNSLPEGNYVFEVANNCGSVKTENITIDGYNIDSTEVEIIPACSSFGLELMHNSNGNYVQSFWLQKFNLNTNTWGHPQTGVPYTEGMLPTAANSVFLNNNGITPSLTYSGDFRIVKVFYIYSNASASNILCTSVIHEFEFQSQVSISNVYGFPCANGGSQVIVDAQGVAPLNYIIVDSSGNVVIDNGTSNVFTGLTEGVYTIEVSDQCGNSQPYTIDVNDLVPLAITGENLCEGEEGQLSVTQFSFLTYEWWKSGTPEVILSTSSVLALSPFDSDIHAGTYFVKVSSSLGAGCGDQILQYNVPANDSANAGADSLHEICNSGSIINLESYLSTPHDEGGTWLDVNGTGVLTGSSLNTADLSAGTYTFTYTVTDNCGSIDTAVITIVLKEIPAPPSLIAVDTVCEGQNIQLGTTTIADTYQWTGPDGFTSSMQNPVIENAGIANVGIYSLMVTVNGCTSGASMVNVLVNELPDYTLEGTTLLCDGQTGILSVVPLNFIQADYKWYYEGVLQEEATHAEIEIFEAGIYRVIVTIDNCSTEQEIEVVKNTNAFTVELEQGCKNFEYMVFVANASALTDVSYTWTGPNGFTASGSQIIITNEVAGNYNVEVMNAEGCVVTMTENVLNTSCFIPRGISPGDAGFNNSFDLSNMLVQHLSIFNRYGVKVYEKENYTNEWHGQSDNGKDLPTGTYYYEITLSEGQRLTGWVYLQRAN